MGNLLKNSNSPIINFICPWFRIMSNIDKILDNPPDSVVDFDEHEMYRKIVLDISDNGVVVQYHDRYAIGELATMLCEKNRLCQSLKEEGESRKVQGDRNIVTKKNPARDALEKLRPQILRLMKEFKMTPNSRGKISGAIGGQGNDDGFDEV